MRAINSTRNTVLVEQGGIAGNPWTRMRGLLGRKFLAQGDGLLLKGDQAIHSVGMQFEFDALFLDRTGVVVHMIQVMPRLRFSPFVFRAQDVLELPAGTIARTGTLVGDKIEIQTN